MRPLPDGSRLKLDRAQVHLDWLNRRIDELERGKAYAFRTYANADGTKHEVRVVAKRSPQISWGVRIGELLFNLRSALDQLIVALVDDYGGTQTNRIQFPIFDVDDKRAQLAMRELSDARLPGPAMTELKALQPYNGREPNHPQFSFFEGLRLLHELNRIDKHRLLHVLAVIADDFTFPLDQFPEGRFNMVPVDAVDDGTLLAEFYPKKPQSHMKVNGEVGILIGIEKTTETPVLPWGIFEVMIDSAETCAARMRGHRTPP